MSRRVRSKDTTLQEVIIGKEKPLMDYTQITPPQREAMLKAIGVETVDDLFTAIPENCRFTGDLNLPPAASELDLQNELAALSEDNNGANTSTCFMGAGAYDHFIPTLIDQIIGRGEFLTAYTPYQAEASQGALQAFFEFQTQIARLTGMDIANASLYDGATAVAEAAMLAVQNTGKRRVIIASTVNPQYRTVLQTYVSDLPIELVELGHTDGRTDPDTLRDSLDDDTACVIIQSPNYYGLIEDWTTCFETAHERKKTLAVAVFNPIACGLLKRPGECNADIAVGEGQPLGNPLNYGGPYLGLFAATKKLMRKMPGRLVGQTTDTEGRQTYCLALQTREQHIRREKATSNICTNQGLLALRATVFLNTVGPQGLAEMAEQCYHKAHYLADEIAKIPGYSLSYGSGTFFHEFVVKCPVPVQKVIDAGREIGIHLGPALNSDELLICVTEKRTRQEMDQLIEMLQHITN